MKNDPRIDSAQIPRMRGLLQIPYKPRWQGQDISTNHPNKVTNMAKVTSYESDIRPLFTERDIQAMSKAINLASYDDVKAHAAVIYNRIRGIGGIVMPPPPPRGECPWPQERIQLFARWMADGYQP